MTDRHSGYHVMLEHDIREDDAEAIMNAIRMIKGVAYVGPVVAHWGDALARERRDSAWRESLRKLAGEGPPA